MSDGKLELRVMAVRAREHILDMAVDGGCFVGSALSCVDLLVCLYSCFLRIDSKRIKSPLRDYLFLSKGHAVPALYAVLIEIGILEKYMLKRNVEDGLGRLYWHPDRRLPGVDFFSGSLGHGLPLAVGAALDCKVRGHQNRVVVLVGDGELNEGSNWEAMLVAKAYKLDNLLIIIDRNKFQANNLTEELIPLEPLVDKLTAFNCITREADGHNYNELVATLKDVPFIKGAPSALIANTIRGKGIPELEDLKESWFLDLEPEEAIKYRSMLQKV
jgi:transketolase